MEDEKCVILGGIPNGMGACRIPDRFIEDTFGKHSCEKKLKGQLVNLKGIKFCSIDDISDENFRTLHSANIFSRDLISIYGFGNWTTFDKKFQEMMYEKKFNNVRFYDLAYFHPFRIIAGGFIKAHVFEIGNTLKKLLVLSRVPTENEYAMLPFDEIFLDIDFTKGELQTLGTEVDFDKITGILVQKLEIRKRKAKRFYRDGRIKEVEIAPVEDISKKVGLEKTDEYAEAETYPDALDRITHQSRTYKDIVDVLREHGKDFKQEVEKYPHCKRMMVDGKVCVECISEEPGPTIGDQMVITVLGQNKGEEFFEQYTTDVNINVEKEKADEAYEGIIHKKTKKFVKHYVLNFLNFLHDPEVQYVVRTPDEARQMKRRQASKRTLPPRVYIHLSGEKKRYIDSLSLDKDVWKVSHRFWVMGHYMRFKHERYTKMRGKKIYVFAYVKGKGLTVEKKYKAEMGGFEEVDQVPV